MTMIDKIKIALVGLIVLAVMIGVLRIQSLTADKVRLTSAVELAQTETAGLLAEADTLRRALADSQAAFKEREKQKAQLAAQTEELRSELEELYRANEPCQTWADSPVPDPVYKRLRK